MTATVKTNLIEPSTGTALTIGNAGQNVVVGADSINNNTIKDLGGGYTIESFPASTTWTAPTGVTSVEYLVVAGGGGGGGAQGSSGGYRHGGGGGAGGYRAATGFSVTPGQSYTVTVGTGGAGGSGAANGSDGTNSVFSTITATGGGGGGSYGNAGGGGGSGGGGACSSTNGGPGNEGSHSPAEGYAGGPGGSYSGNSSNAGGGGGGGASEVGGTGVVTAAGNGGDGIANSITGSSVYYAGGGGGGKTGGGYETRGSGGLGGGGTGATNGNGGAATPRTGGGGGGAGNSQDPNTSGGVGGSGIVILKYVALSSTIFTSNGSGTLSNVNVGFGGSQVLLQTVTVSSAVAQIAFTSGIDDTYKEYLFEMTNIVPVSDNVDYKFEVSTNFGSSYGVAQTTTNFAAIHNQDNSHEDLAYQAGMDLANSTNPQTISWGNTPNSNGALCGEMHLFNPAGTFIKNWYLRTNQKSTNPRSQDQFAAGFVNTTAAVNAIKFVMSSGNITAGTIKMYGIR